MTRRTSGKELHAQYCVGPGESCARPETYYGEVALCLGRTSPPKTRSVLEAVNFAAVSPLTTAEIAGNAELNHTTNWIHSATNKSSSRVMGIGQEPGRSRISTRPYFDPLECEIVYAIAVSASMKFLGQFGGGSWSGGLARDVHDVERGSWPARSWSPD